ncbi:transposase [Fimbriiglobus ruber]|nr:transposase [Fimbriiglobus ruber]
MRADDANPRTVHTLAGITRLHLTVRRCHQYGCVARRRPYRPEAGGASVLPRHEFGLDVIALIGALRYTEHRSIPEIRAHLVGRGVTIAERTVTNLLDRYDELLAVALADDRRLRTLLGRQGRVLLGVDGWQPDVGHEVLWVIRDCLSGEILLAESLLSARHQDLGELLAAVKAACPVPVAGIVSDGQASIRKAVAAVFPDTPYQRCPFHFLREAARPIYEADRHAKKELQKTVRGVRGIERTAEGRTDPAADVIRGYCSAVRSALTDDGRPPVEASGLRLHDRLTAIHESLGRAEEKGGFRPNSGSGKASSTGGLEATLDLWLPVRTAFAWVHQAAHILGLEAPPGTVIRAKLGGLLGAMRRHRKAAGERAKGVDHFVKVSRRYWPGLFACYDTPDLPRTNNDLEQAFGSHRYHERRATGRKGASPALVLRGSARLVAGLATRRQKVTAADLAGANPAQWKQLRAALEERRQRRVERKRFRRDPQGYLKDLEIKLNQLSLPA